MKPFLNLLALGLLLLLSACALPALTVDSSQPQSPGPTVQPGLPTPPPAALLPTPTPAKTRVFVPGVVSANDNQVYPPPATATAAATATPTPTLPPTPTATKPGDIARIAPYEPHTGEKLPPEQWKKWPVLPTLSQRAREIYQRGLARGTNPRHFSKIGDCQVIRQYFLGYFDDGDQSVRLGDNYNKLKGTLENFRGSYTRVSMAVRTGFNVASVLSPINADPKVCKGGETPLACEFREWNPSIVIISMETWTSDRPTTGYEGYLRQIVDTVLARDILPILATKADNLEGDHSINAMIARVGYEYDLPVWNFWAAADPLPAHGLTEDGFHLTNGPSFLTGDNLKLAWNVRNLTALQALEKVWREASAKK